ncbi:hypothetical protein F0U59_23365 [Archangium gephyra]|nr:hypothetical protein F0U59_23365 [Archangium gephyra]
MQEALPLAPPAAPAGEPPSQQALATPPVPQLQLEAPSHPAGAGWVVLWVTCEDCGRGRHVDVASGRHGATPVRGVTLADHPAWARCQHGVPYWENCRGAPVAPPCCPESSP